ncbi:MAG: GNAT family N-acetyltransferase [bacterium]
MIYNLTIRPLNDSDSIEELTDLLHRAYAVLAEMGFRYYATHQTPEQTKERISKGQCYVAVFNDNIIGTITYYTSENTHGSPFLNTQGVSHMGQMGVEPALQKHGIATKLIKYVEQIAHENGDKELALDTAEGASHLIEWYKRLGYRFIEYISWDVTNYRSVVMSKKICD